MKSSTQHAFQRYHLSIFNFLILGASLIVSQLALMAQSRTGSIVKSPRSAAGYPVEKLLNDRASSSGNNSECIQRMAKETSRYVQKARIPIKAAKGEYFADQDTEAYLLSSEEKLNLSAGKDGKKIVSVINYKVGSANSAFYVIEAQTKRDSLVYSVKRDGRVLRSLPVRLSVQLAIKGPGVDPCIQINKDNADLIAGLQTSANQTCQTRGACVGFCSNFGATIAWSIVQVKPTNWKCFLDEAQYNSTSLSLGWVVAVEEPTRGGLYDWTIWKAIRNDSALFF